MGTQVGRRSRVGAATSVALGMLLAVSGTLTPASAASDAAATGEDRAKAPTTGRFVTTTKKGIVLVDEDGGRRHTIIPADRRDNISLWQANARTGTLLYSTRRAGSDATRPRLWRVANLFGVELGTFKTPWHVEPVVDSGGFHAYWLQGDGAGATYLMRLQVGDPRAKPAVVRQVSPVLGANLSISPDDRFLAVASQVDRGLGGRLSILATDGSSEEIVPTPVGETFVWFRPVWAPDSSRVTFQTQTDPTAVPAASYSLYSTPAEGDHTATLLGQLPSLAFDWSPDARTILGRVPDGSGLVSLDVATGQTTGSRLERRPADALVLWSGLRAGEVPRDRVQPRLRIAQPDCGDRSAAACTRYRHTVAAWRVVGGPVADRGGSQLRYVAVAAIQRRGQDWWALVGAPDSRHGTWRRFPNRGEAKWAAKERTARFADGRWRIAVPGLTAGRLFLVAKAVDGVGNKTERTVAQTIG